MAQQNRMAYPIEEAFALIGVSRTRGYQLIASGELSTWRDGKRRFASRATLEQYVSRKERENADRAA
jgi:excisionase family DNA binding protein